MVIPRFVAQALAGEAVTVHGDGSQIRCFCHVRDVVPALVKLMDDPGESTDRSLTLAAPNRCQSASWPGG